MLQNIVIANGYTAQSELRGSQPYCLDFYSVVMET